MNTLSALGSVAGILAAIVGFNLLLITFTREPTDYFFGNAFLLVLGYLTYLTIEVRKLKGVK